MLSDSLRDIINNIIDSYIDYEDCSVYYKDDIIDVLTQIQLIINKLLDVKHDIARVYVTNLLEKALFKSSNCKCDSEDYCKLCYKYEKTFKMLKLESEILALEKQLKDKIIR